MLTIEIPPSKEMDIWDEKKEEFVHINAFKGITLKLEHSLISISRWESKWHVPFLGNEKKTEEQTLHYIKCMCINPDIPDDVFNHLTTKNIQEISDYIKDPMTATTIYNPNKSKSREVVTSELLYFYMIANNIPSEFDKWHLNRLIQLLEVCNVKNSPPKKMSKDEIIRRNAALNEARRAKYKTKG